MGMEKLRSMPGQRHHSTLDPKNTNRFTSSSSSASPSGDTHKGSQSCKCSSYNSKMYNGLKN